jgi:radical SAM superfamily enzyme YgiQ (UPF0313 family)
MRVLLLSMPDSFEHMSTITTRMPNGALASLAGNVDPHHEVALADLVLVQGRVRRTVERLLDEHRPDVVGLSVMTFQRPTARRIAALARARRPEVVVVAGGYDPSLAPEAYTTGDGAADVIVRGEGDITFRELLRALESRSPLSGVAGLSYREDGAWRRNPDRAVSRLAGEEVRPPRRSARVLKGYTLLGRPVDVVETSRGCTFDCSFCSIIEMRGRNFNRFPIARVLDDIRDARDHGARAIFLVDDNITLDVKRFEELCRAIVDAGLHHLDYVVQAMTSAIADHGETLAPLMRRAGFRYVFLGIENVLEDDLDFLRAGAKNVQHGENGARAGNASRRAVELLRKSGLYVVGGLIVGSPDDTREKVEANLAFAREFVDWPYIQHPTPYPGTPMTVDLRNEGLILHDRVEEYDGTTAVVRSRHMEADDIEFLRWRSERWMKMRHFPAALRHSPLFVLKNGPKMLRHTLRGSWRALVGLESERAAFERYRAIRRAEREYL